MGASKVVCLTNLLSEKALASDVEFAECVHDIRAECEQFGRVEAFVVPRERALEGRPASDVGKCFIVYEDVSSATRFAPPNPLIALSRGWGVLQRGRGGLLWRPDSCAFKSCCLCATAGPSSLCTTASLTG